MFRPKHLRLDQEAVVEKGVKKQRGGFVAGKCMIQDLTPRGILIVTKGFSLDPSNP
jgi:hypothetical protein